MPANKILTSRLDYRGLGLGLETWYQSLGLGLENWWPSSWSWSRDLVAKVLVLVSRPGGQGLGLGLETRSPRSWSRVLFKGLDNKSAFITIIPWFIRGAIAVVMIFEICHISLTRESIS